MNYPERSISTIHAAGEDWRLIWREFSGYRVRHGEYVEWPVIIPGNKFRWADYEFNGERSVPSPNTAIPPEVTAAVSQLIGG